MYIHRPSNTVSQELFWSTKAHGNGDLQTQRILEIELRFVQSAQGLSEMRKTKKNKKHLDGDFNVKALKITNLFIST